jgi:hypothetical protein
MSEPTLPEKILAIHHALVHASIAHAFGGALALAYYAEPRATDDIDVNIFLAPANFTQVQLALEPLGVDTHVDIAAVERDGQCRVSWTRTPIDVFLAYDDIHQAMRKQARLVPFGDQRIPILSPEHLLTCKVIFDRPKDWLDIEQMLVCVEDLDMSDVQHWLQRILGADDPRHERLEQLAQATGES